MKQPPLLMRSELTDAVYVVTRYRRTGVGIIEALEKHDVTDQFVTVALEFGEDWWNARTGRAAMSTDGEGRS